MKIIEYALDNVPNEYANRGFARQW